MLQRPSQTRLARKTPAAALSPTTGQPVAPDLSLAFLRARARLDALLRTSRRRRELFGWSGVAYLLSHNVYSI